MRSSPSVFYIFRMVLRCIFLAIIFLSNANIYAVEHKVFNELLSKYVSLGKVDYTGIKTKSQETLLTYLNLLSKIKPAELINSTQSDQLAVYINAYNAFTIAAVLDHWPVESIRDIPNVWKEKKYK